MVTRNLRHIVLANPPESMGFSPRGGSRGESDRIPARDRLSHSTLLNERLKRAWEDAENDVISYEIERNGIYLEFRGDPGYELLTTSLESLQSKDPDKHIRLLNVRKYSESPKDASTPTETQCATVFVPNSRKAFFFERIEKYADERRDKSGNPRYYSLINSIADIRRAVTVRNFWTDAPELIPSDKEAKWCEVWLRDSGEGVSARFIERMRENGIVTNDQELCFPERIVRMVHADRRQLETIIHVSDDLAEFRCAKETADFWTELPNREQAGWVQDLLRRLKISASPSVSVCLLDTGVNNGHPLLSPILSSSDCHAVISGWGVFDGCPKGHGTCMAGIAAYGDLVQCLMSLGPVEVRHCLESVKIIPNTPQQPQKREPELWGYMTAQGISRAEISAPERKRIHCLATTAENSSAPGYPTSWSAALDQISSDVDSDDRFRRLIIVSAGNCDGWRRGNYPSVQCMESIQDPAQSWNALTVGAYTALDQIRGKTYQGYTPTAPRGGLSPYTTTSCLWDEKCPNKPDVVMEGGNTGQDSESFISEVDDLSPLSTSSNTQVSHFVPFMMTSAATAQAAQFAAQVQTSYPDLWPETIRGLMVHSATWPKNLEQQFVGRKATKKDYGKLLRIAGYGVPDLGRALYSASNSLTLISQSKIQPFFKKENGGCCIKDMNFHALPWPSDALKSLPDSAKVEMRVTLSYFIEPSPGEIGWKDRYRYPSHGLRFDLNSPGESRDEFVKRINAAALEEDEERPSTKGPSGFWRIGSKARDRGSIHSDIWEGSAADLAASNMIAVFPVGGWWKDRAYLGRWDRTTRYALIVSISTPEESVDIYTPVAIQIGIPVSIS